MTPADDEGPDGPPAPSGATAAAVLLLLTATLQIAYGAAAIGGLGALEENVRDIESKPQYGELYLSLGVWGVLLVLAGLAQLAAGVSLARRGPSGRLPGLSATLPGLAVAIFTLALFEVAALVTLVLLIAALYVLSYRVEG